MTAVSIAADVLAAAAFVGLWIYCKRKGVGPIEAMTPLVGRAEQAMRRKLGR